MRRGVICAALGIAALVLLPSLAEASTITTSAGPNVVLGTVALSDQATVTGDGVVPPTGTVTFELFGPTDLSCMGPPLFTTDAPLGAAVGDTATATSAGFTPTTIGEYHWRASYGGDGAPNAPVSGACGDPGETQTVTQALPTITTFASPSVTLGAGVLSDTATVNGLVSAVGGTVTFELFGPDEAACGTALASTDVPLSVNPSGTSGTATAPDFTPTAAGIHRWVATYNGDDNNAAVAGTCGDATETRSVAKTTPTIATVASPGVPIGGQLSDTATLSGLVSAVGGTVTFDLFAPGDTGCAGAPVFTTTVGLNVNGARTAGTAASSSFTPDIAGVYRWKATYNGDASNGAVSGLCNDTGETATVAQAAPTIATTASPGITLGGQLSATATVTELFNPAGGVNVTFELFGPGDALCGGPPAFSSIQGGLSNGPGTMTFSSPAFRPTAAGDYHWRATFNGDVNNAPVTGACNDPAERQTVASATAAITTRASASLGLGAGQLSDAATVTGVAGAAPSGTVTFQLYGPDDATCIGGTVFTDTQPLTPDAPTGTATATSAGFSPLAMGTYRWRAVFFPDDTNYQLVAAPCNAPGETVTVGAAGAPPAAPPPPAVAQAPAAPVAPAAPAAPLAPAPPAPSGPTPPLPRCNGKTATIVAVAGEPVNGTAGDDVIVGTDSADTIKGNGGRDTVCARGGNDDVRGGGDDDTILGGDGRDTIRGGAGDDLLIGDRGNDLLLGGSGNDDLRAGAGNDRLAGGDGADVADGGSGNDLLDDQRLGGKGRDKLFGGSGSDRVRTAGGSADVVDCGTGRDSVLLGRTDRQKRCERLTRSRFAA